MKTKYLLVSFVLLSGLLAGCASDVRIENPYSNEVETPDQQLNEIPEASLETEVNAQILNGGISETLSGELSDITLNSVSFAKSSQYFQPENGHFLVVNLTIKNNSEEFFNISSLANFELQGADLYIYSQAFGVDTRGSLDSTLAPGSSLRGEIVYDIPEVASFELRYKEGAFSESTANFKFGFSDISR